MGTPHRWADAIKAFADGEAIECRDNSYCEWLDWPEGSLYNPDFSSGEWRRKPKPRFLRYRLYQARAKVGYVIRVVTYDHLKHPEDITNFVGWLTDWTTTELLPNCKELL